MRPLLALLLLASTAHASEGFLPKSRAVRSGTTARRTRSVGVAHVNHGPSGAAAGSGGAAATTSASVAYSGGPSSASHPVFSGGRELQRPGSGLSPGATPRILASSNGTSAQAAASSYTGGGSGAITASRATPVGGAGAFTGKADTQPQAVSAGGDGFMKGVLNGLANMFGSMAEMLGGGSSEKK